MPEAITTRLTAFAASLREVGAIRSDAVEQAFASVDRHRCVPEFRYGPQTICVAQDRLPDNEVLDMIYSHQSLLTSTGHSGGLPSSSSAPTLMARMLEALNLELGMRVLEIGAGTGYNAALIATITGAPVFTVDADATTAAETGHRHSPYQRSASGIWPYGLFLPNCGRILSLSAITVLSKRSAANNTILARTT